MHLSDLLTWLAVTTSAFATASTYSVRERLLDHLLTHRETTADTPRPWIRALTTKDSNISRPTCYDYPDRTSDWPSVSPNGQIKLFYNPSSAVNLTCWTTQIRSPNFADQRTRCAPNFNSLWFKTTDDCWVPDTSLQLGVDGSSLAKQLSDLLIYCPHQLRQTAIMREQYRWQTYCYTAPSLSAESTPLHSQDTGNVEVGCWKAAEYVRGDTTWWSVRGNSGPSLSKGCWLPNQVFDPVYFTGNAHECLG